MRVKHLFPCFRAVDAEKDAGAGAAPPAAKAAESDEIADKSRPSIKELQIQESAPADERGSLWLQFAAAISVSLAIMGCGSHLSWTSPALPYLEGPGSRVPLSAYQGSWVASLYTLGSILGSLLSPVLIDRLGRKGSLLAFALPQLAGWGLIIPARGPAALYAGRLVAGVAHGGIYNAAVIYLAEIADRRVRGAFGTLLKLGTNLGGLFVTSLGACLAYEQLNLAALCLPLAFLATFAPMPESPYFELARGREERAAASLLRLRRLGPGARALLEPELGAMRAAHREAAGGPEAGGRRFAALIELFSRPGNRRGLWILLGLKATQQLSGHMAIVAYTQEIFAHSGSRLQPQHAVVLLGLAQLAAGLAAAALVDRLGRRPLVLLSGLSAALALGLVGLFFYLKYGARADVSSITWLPVAALIGYEVMVALGIGTVPYVILGEIFPTRVRGPAVASGILVGSLLAFLVSLGFKALNAAAGIHTTFWFFAACCASGTLWVFAITPETKGKSLEEIQALFNPAPPPSPPPPDDRSKTLRV